MAAVLSGGRESRNLAGFGKAKRADLRRNRHFRTALDAKEVEEGQIPPVYRGKNERIPILQRRRPGHGEAVDSRAYCRKRQREGAEDGGGVNPLSNRRKTRPSHGKAVGSRACCRKTWPGHEEGVNPLSNVRKTRLDHEEGGDWVAGWRKIRRDRGDAAFLEPKHRTAGIHEVAGSRGERKTLVRGGDGDEGRPKRVRRDGAAGAKTRDG